MTLFNVNYFNIIINFVILKNENIGKIIIFGSSDTFIPVLCFQKIFLIDFLKVFFLISKFDRAPPASTFH